MTDSTYLSLLYLWEKRTLYIGPLYEPLSLSQGAATLVLALDMPILFTIKEQTTPIQCNSILLPPGHPIDIEAQGAIIVNCNLDALGEDFAAISTIMQKKQGLIAYQIEDEKEIISKFISIYQSRQSSKSTYEQLNKILNTKHLLKNSNFTIDQRVADVITLIKKTVDDNLSVEDLANSVNLSVPRLVQLFKYQTGIPIRRYRLWHRLYIAAVKMSQGQSLTTAAITAGFTDSSHLSHTFRSMLGMKPSLIFSQANKIIFYIQQEDEK